MAIALGLLAMATPVFTHLIDYTRAENLASQLTQTIRFAKSVATSQGLVTLDSRSNQLTVSKDQQVLLTQVFKASHAVLIWRGALHQPKLIFSANPYLQNVNGSFWLCATDHAKPWWGIMLNRAGHMHRADTDELEKAKKYC